MKIQKVFSNVEDREDKLYSVLMSENEISLFSEFQKEFTRAEKAILDQFIKRTKNFRHMPGGQITNVKTANHLKSITEKLSGKIQDNLTKEEYKALKKIGLSEAAKPGVLDKIKKKYYNPEAWERLANIKKLDNKTEGAIKRGEKSKKYYNDQIKRFRQKSNDVINTKEEQKVSNMLKRFRRKHGTSLLEDSPLKKNVNRALNPEYTKTLINTANESYKGVNRNIVAKDILNYAIDVPQTKGNIDQIKKLGKQNRDIIVLSKSSSPAAIEHEAGHNRIKPNLNPKRKSSSKRYNKITERLEKIAEENGASARSLENIKRIPQVNINKSKKQLNSSIGTYIGGFGKEIINR